MACPHNQDLWCEDGQCQHPVCKYARRRCHSDFSESNLAAIGAQMKARIAADPELVEALDIVRLTAEELAEQRAETERELAEYGTQKQWGGDE